MTNRRMSIHEVAAREAKAAKLAEVLATNPQVASHPAVELAGEDFRILVAGLAGTRVPSETTWDRACELARGIMARRGRDALRIVDDERLVGAAA